MMEGEDHSIVLKKWLNEELLVFSKRVRPDSLDNVTEKLCRGKNDRIWTFIANHVRSRLTVLKIKNRLRVRKYLTSHKSDSSTDACQSISSCSDIILWQLNSLSARKALLKKLICDLESEISGLDEKCQALKNAMIKDRNVSSNFNKAVHFFNKQSTLYGEVANVLRSGLCINKVKVPPINTRNIFPLTGAIIKSENSVNYVDAHQLSFEENFNPMFPLDIRSVISNIRNLFQQIIESNSIDVKPHKRELWSVVAKLINEYAARDIMTCVQKDCELDTDDLECISIKSTEGAQTSNTNNLNLLINLPSSIELHKLTMLHIKLFVSKEKLNNKVNGLYNESVLLLEDIMHQIVVESNEELKRHILEVDILNSTSVHTIQQLKQIISDIYNKEQTLQFYITNEPLRNDEIAQLHSQISNRRNAMCEFLLQNKTILSSFGKKCSLYTFVTNSLKAENKVLTNNISQLNYDFHLEKELLIQKSSGLWAIDYSAQNAMQLHFEDESVILRKCLDAILCTREEDAIMSRQRTLSKFKCSEASLVAPDFKLLLEKQTKEDQKKLKQLCSTVDAGSEIVKLGELCLLKIKEDLCNWWEQPAQFIPPITIENRSLKEWKNVLAVL